MRRVLVLLSMILVFSCGTDDSSEAVDNFDRKAMLTHWADNIIVPGYNQYLSDLTTLQESVSAFSAGTSVDNLVTVRGNWLRAYQSWQRVSMFEVGKAEELTLRNFTNIYPTDAEEIITNISSGQYNLELPSKNDEQGFPALDYMLNGLAETDSDIVEAYTNSQSHMTYLVDLTARLHALTTQVVNDWDNGYREIFIDNDGSSATSSVDKLVNDYMFYYEKFLRAGKIGIPVGVFSGSVNENAVEAIYTDTVSRALFMVALDATQNFFNGQSFDSNSSGPSMKSYLDELEANRNGSSLSEQINDAFEAARSKANLLNESFRVQLSTDTKPMFETYDALQEAVILLKVDMFQALNISVDFVDADGD